MDDAALTVLVVEGPSPVPSPLTSALASEGFAVHIASNEPDALRSLAATATDLIILDLGTPGADGLQLLRSLRAQPSPRHVSIVVLCGHEEREIRRAALQLGADDFILKPWDPEELLARCWRCLQTKRRIDTLLEQTAELQKLSVTDGLTQVHNHRFFQERLREEFRRAQRYDDPLALILVDVDHFKGINDRYGHPIGDMVLREVANAVRGCVRETDLLARYGGEEFAILLPKTTSGGALKVADRVWRDLGELKLGHAGSLRLTASLGVSTFPHRAVLSAEQLVRTADDALYRAKREGRNRVCLYQQLARLSDPTVQSA